MAANYFDHPADSMIMVGITGTNGKTTTTYLLKTILEAKGHTVGLIGTNQNMIGDEILPTERTTPESFELHKLFAQMRDAGCTHVIMEVSSHSLVLDRVYGIEFTVGAFTNLTQDHLDFHKTMEAYRDAKALLFHQSKTGVTNLDDAAGKFMLEQKACPFLSYGEHEACDLRAADIQLHADSIGFVCESAGGQNRGEAGDSGTVHCIQCAVCTVLCEGTRRVGCRCLQMRCTKRTASKGPVWKWFRQIPIILYSLTMPILRTA